jgi:hypothetical protein
LEGHKGIHSEKFTWSSGFIFTAHGRHMSIQMSECGIHPTAIDRYAMYLAIEGEKKSSIPHTLSSAVV